MGKPSSSIAIADFSDHLRQGHVERFSGAGFHTA